MILILAVAIYLYQQQKRKFFPLGHLMSHKFKEVTYFLELTVRLNHCKMLSAFFWKQILIISAHVGSRLIFFLSVVGNFLLILSVVSNVNPIHTLIEAIALTILISSDISLLAPMHISFPFSHLLSPFEMAFPTVCC